MEWLLATQKTMETNIQNNNQQNTNKRNIVEFFILPPVFAQTVALTKISY